MKTCHQKGVFVDVREGINIGVTFLVFRESPVRHHRNFYLHDKVFS